MDGLDRQTGRTDEQDGWTERTDGQIGLADLSGQSGQMEDWMHRQLNIHIAGVTYPYMKYQISKY